jgi:hypothetical protein
VKLRSKGLKVRSHKHNSIHLVALHRVRWVRLHHHLPVTVKPVVRLVRPDLLLLLPEAHQLGEHLLQRAAKTCS